jgi:hypothetical protein
VQCGCHLHIFTLICLHRGFHLSLSFFFFFDWLGFELRALHLQSRYSTAPVQSLPFVFNHFRAARSVDVDAKMFSSYNDWGLVTTGKSCNQNLEPMCWGNSGVEVTLPGIVSPESRCKEGTEGYSSWREAYLAHWAMGGPPGITLLFFLPLKLCSENCALCLKRSLEWEGYWWRAWGGLWDSTFLLACRGTYTLVLVLEGWRIYISKHSFFPNVFPEPWNVFWFLPTTLLCLSTSMYHKPRWLLPFTKSWIWFDHRPLFLPRWPQMKSPPAPVWSTQSKPASCGFLLLTSINRVGFLHVF